MFREVEDACRVLRRYFSEAEDAARQRLVDIDYGARELAYVRENHPALLSNEELDRRLAEHDRWLDGEDN